MGPQPSQKSFETMLWNDFRKLDPSEGKIIWIENEGNKVGKVHTPQPLRKMITSSSKIFVKPSIDQRVDHIMREYTVDLCCQEISKKVLKTFNTGFDIYNTRVPTRLTYFFFINGLKRSWLKRFF